MNSLIASPCIGLCKMDDFTGLCIGCLRTLDEITRWGGASDGAKIAILAAIEKRRQDYDPHSGELRGDCDRL